MDFTNITMQRQSCRKYDTQRKVPADALALCVEATRMAPSACNSQPWHLTVCTGELAAQIAPCTMGMGINKFTSQVPCFVVMSDGDYSASAAAGSILKHQDYRSIDIGIAAAYFTAEATEQGLATCILGWFDEKKLQALLGIDKHIRLILAVGYAASEDTLRTKVRKETQEIVTYRE